MRVDDLMSAPVFVAAPDDTVGHVKNLMLKHKVSRIIIAYESALVGVITKYDLAEMLESSEAGWRRRHQDLTLAKTIMTEDPVTTSPDVSLTGVAQELIANKIGCLPVVQDSELLGIVTETDLVAHFADTRSRVKVATIMNDAFLTCHRHHSINHVLNEMDTHRLYRVVVQEGNNVPVGIITHTNLAFAKEPFIGSKDILMVRKAVRAGVQKDRYIEKVLQVAEDIMSEPLITIEQDATAVEAARQMLEQKIDALPVVKDGTLVGIVSKPDIVQQIAGVA